MDSKYAPMYSTHGHGRKTHIATIDGSLCGVERQYPGRMWTQGEDYYDVESQFFIDPDGYGCKRCGAQYRRAEKEK